MDSVNYLASRMLAPLFRIDKALGSGGWFGGLMEASGRGAVRSLAIVRCPRPDCPCGIRRQQTDMLLHQQEGLFSIGGFHGPNPFNVDRRSFRRFGPDDELHHGIPYETDAIN